MMPGMTDDDVARLSEERDGLVAEVAERPAPTAYFQPPERIASLLERARWRERRIAELDTQIAAHEDDDAQGS